MRDKDVENLIREAFILKKIKRMQKDKRDCLSEEVLCDYLMSGLTPNKKEVVENHLSICPLCRMIFTTLVELEEPEKIELKEKIFEKVNTTVEAMKISVKWAKGKLVLIKTNAEYIPFWDDLKPVLVRGDLQKATMTLPVFEKAFPEYKVIAQMEEEEKEGKCSIHCYIYPLIEKSHKTTIRFELIKGKRVISSYKLKDNIIVFQEITPGEYLIKIKEGEKILALLSIEIFDKNDDSN